MGKVIRSIPEHLHLEMKPKTDFQSNNGSTFLICNIKKYKETKNVLSIYHYRQQRIFKRQKNIHPLSSVSVENIHIINGPECFFKFE